MLLTRQCFWPLIKNSCSVKFFTFPPCNSVPQVNRLRVGFLFIQVRDDFLTITMRGEEPGVVWICIGCYSLPCPLLIRRGGGKGKRLLGLWFPAGFKPQHDNQEAGRGHGWDSWHKWDKATVHITRCDI